MHEISLVRNIFNTLNSEFAAADIARIRAIKIKTGVLANVEPILLQNAFDAVVATDSPEFKHTRLVVTKVPIKIFCHTCQQSSDVEQYTFVCQHCQQPCNNITQGDELLIEGIEMDD